MNMIWKVQPLLEFIEQSQYTEWRHWADEKIWRSKDKNKVVRASPRETGENRRDVSGKERKELK